MMKYKVGDKIKFVKDCKLASGSVIQAKSVWVVNDTSKEYYLLRGVGENLFANIEQELVDNSCEKINEALSITKQMDEKHDILNGLTKIDDALTEKVEHQNDLVNHPSHYKDGKIEVIDFIEDKKLGYHLGNACKYICRCQLKNGGKDKVQDLRKAIWYIERQIYLWEG